MNLRFAHLSRWTIVYLDNCCYSRLTDADALPDTIAETALTEVFAPNGRILREEDAFPSFFIYVTIDFITPIYYFIVNGVFCRV